MKPHTKIYLDYFGHTTADFIPCEVCEAKAVDIHHIDSRGMGGTKKDIITNLMALCRECHTLFGDVKSVKSQLVKIHNLHLKK